MSNPTETPLTTAAAAALSGTTDSGTGAAYCTIGQAEYYTADYRKEAINNRVLSLANQLRVVKDGEMTCGVWSGCFLDGATVRTYAGSSDNALTDDTTNYVYLDASGSLTINTTGWPEAAHVPLATIDTGTASAAGVSGAYDHVDITDFRARAIFRPVGERGTRSLESQTLDYGDFTDNGDASGYIDFTTGQIPAGAVVTGFKAVVATGFTGDTTAVIEVGKSGDTDAYSADTAQSVLGAGTVGSGSNADANFVAAATTPRVTVTGAADFGNISAGSMTVTVYYLPLQ